jgi:hypothetical protein
MPGPVLLLGPQRPVPNMPAALATVPGAGRVVYITAGWRHEENDDEALKRDVGVDGHPLALYQWFEELARTAPDLFAAHHQQQDEIRRLKALYRLRLDPALEALRVLLAHQRQQPDSDFIRWELEDATAVLKGLRERFVTQCDAVRARFLTRWNPYEHKRVRTRIAELRAILGEARVVLIAGGHVGVLRNRLEFFGLADLLRENVERGMGLIAWSAGAMSLTDYVVLFHDDPPTGQSNPEVLDRGLGLAPGLVALPHARSRLDLDDPLRVGVMASRFDPIPCVGLENGAWLERIPDALAPGGGHWMNRGRADAALRLEKDGTTSHLESPHA